MDPLRNIPRLSELSGHLLSLPTTDRGTFATLTSVQDIQSWTAVKADEYRQFALALLAIRNLTAPIHRLPTEVLERILEQCWEDWKSLRLPHVCRLWRSILLGRAGFWVDAVSNYELLEKRQVGRDELPLVHALLSRSTQRSRTIEPSFYTFPPSIAKMIAPYISSVVSLQVAVGRGDLQDGLWPVLVSGMSALETLEIQLTITDEDLSRYDEPIHGDLACYHSRVWPRLLVLSRKALPKLSRLVCPHNMVGRFGDVSLRHLKVVSIDRSHHSFCHDMPALILGTPQGLHLKPYRDCLETLEIMPTWLRRDDGQPEPLELPSLHHLRITSNRKVVSRILSWLLFPETTLIHITESFSVTHDGTELHSMVRLVNRVCLQQVADSGHSWDASATYHMQCFAGDVERLRIDDLAVLQMNPDTYFHNLLPIFGENAPVTHLVLSTTSCSGALDLFAFPHLVHLDMGGSHMHTIAYMLHPHWNPAGRRLQGQDSPCLGLAELVITCPCLVPSPYTGRPKTLVDSDTNIDEEFHEECTLFQQALAERASRGGRLTSLALSLRLATIPSHEQSDGACGTVAGDSKAKKGVNRKEDVDCTGPENNPDGGGSDEMTRKGAAKPNVMCPSHAARRLLLERLQELVDGPVVLKFLDSAGGEVNFDDDDDNDEA